MHRETRLHRAARWAGIHLLAVVDRADLTTDGTVRIRFRDDAEGQNYDLPATTG